MTVTTGPSGLPDGPLLHTLQLGIHRHQWQKETENQANHQHRQNSAALRNRYCLTSPVEGFAGR